MSLIYCVHSLDFMLSTSLTIGFHWLKGILLETAVLLVIYHIIFFRMVCVARPIVFVPLKTLVFFFVVVHVTLPCGTN